MTVTPYSSAAPVHRDVTAPAPQVPAADTADEGFFGSDGLKFDDFLDLINPLQHLPIISTFYRAVTGTRFRSARGCSAAPCSAASSASLPPW